MRASRVVASTGSSTCSGSRWTDSRPGRLCRLVMMVRAGPDPGSSGRTCASSAALSRTRTTRCFRTSERYRPARSWASAGTSLPGTPSARSSCARASRGVSGVAAMPMRSSESWPSGNRWARVCAACRANAVLPRPGCPQTRVTRGWVGAGSRACACSRARASSRAVKSAMSRGRASADGALLRAASAPPLPWPPTAGPLPWPPTAGPPVSGPLTTGSPTAGPPVPVAGGAEGGAGARRGRPACAACSNSAAPHGSSRSASARAWTVRRCGPRVRPRSMSPTARRLIPAAWASSSWVRPASVLDRVSRSENRPVASRSSAPAATVPTIQPPGSPVPPPVRAPVGRSMPGRTSAHRPPLRPVRPGMSRSMPGRTAWGQGWRRPAKRRAKPSPVSAVTV